LGSERRRQLSQDRKDRNQICSTKQESL
jgi:hypothetical protein